MQILGKLAPLLPPVYQPPCPPWGSKKILSGFWHLSQLKFEEISPKIQRMQILRKLAPLLPPFTCPPVPPGGQKNFGVVSGIQLGTTHPIWPKKLAKNQSESPVLVKQMHDPLCGCTVPRQLDFQCHEQSENGNHLSLYGGRLLTVSFLEIQ